MQFSQQQIQVLAGELVESLSASSKWAEAAQVASQYLADADSAVTLLSDAHQWREALRIAHLHGRADLLETTVVPAAAGSATALMVKTLLDPSQCRLKQRKQAPC